MAAIRVNAGCTQGPQEISPQCALSWGVAENFLGPVFTEPCSVVAQSLPFLPPPKVLAAELPLPPGKRPQLCSRQPKDALLDGRPCSAGPKSAHAEGGQDSNFRPQVRTSPLMHRPAVPELCSAESTKRPPCLLNNHPSAGRTGHGLPRTGSRREPIVPS